METKRTELDESVTSYQSGFATRNVLRLHSGLGGSTGRTLGHSQRCASQRERSDNESVQKRQCVRMHDEQTKTLRTWRKKTSAGWDATDVSGCGPTRHRCEYNKHQASSARITSRQRSVNWKDKTGTIRRMVARECAWSDPIDIFRRHRLYDPEPTHEFLR